MEWVIVALLLFFILYREISALKTMQRTVERKVDLILKQNGVVFDKFADISPDVLLTVQAGKRAEAMRLYRKETGATFKEARDAIRELELNS